MIITMVIFSIFPHIMLPIGLILLYFLFSLYRF